MTDLSDPIDVALAVTRALEAAGVASTIGGSVASSVAGEPRSTVDIDIVAALRQEDVPAVIASLQNVFYINEEA